LSELGTAVPVEAQDARWRRSDRLALGALAVLALLYFGRNLLSAGLSVGFDASDFFYPWWQLGRDLLRAGELPLWNPYQHSGVPLAANPQSGVLYPLNWLLWWLPAARAINVSLALHVLLAGWFTYALARHLRLSPAGSFVAAITFMYSGFFAGRVFAGHIPHVQVACWLPALVLLSDLALQRGSVRLAALGGLVLGLALLAGFPQMVLVSLEAVFLLWAWRLWQSRRLALAVRQAALLAMLLALGLGVAAVQLVPGWELAQNSIRNQAMDWDYVSGLSLRPQELPTVVWPDLFGNGVDLPRWAPGIWHELSPYVGILPLVLALLALGKLRSDERVRWLALLAAVGLILALGRFGPAYRILYALAPLYQFFRVPARHLLLVVLALSLLAGIGFAALQHARRLRVWAVALLALGCLTALLYSAARAQPPPAASPVIAAAVEREPAAAPIVACQPTRLIIAPASEAAATVVAALPLPALNLLVAGLALAFAATRRQAREAPESVIPGAHSLGPSMLPRRFTAVRAVVLAAIVVDLGSFGLRYTYRPVQPEASVQRRYVPAALSAACPELSRVASVGQGSLAPPTGLWYYGSQGWDYGAIFGQYSIHGYDPLFLRRYGELFCQVDGQPVPLDAAAFGGSVGNGASPILRLLNVGCVVSDQALPDARFEPLGGGSQVVSRLRDALPRAWVVHRVRVEPDDEKALALLASPAFDPAQEVVVARAPAWYAASQPLPDTASEVVRFESYSANHMALSAGLQSAGYLVLSEVYYPGWVATVDGAPAPVEPVDYALRGISLPAGSHRVTLEYRPASLMWGAALSVLSLLLALVLCLSPRRRAQICTPAA